MITTAKCPDGTFYAAAWKENGELIEMTHAMPSRKAARDALETAVIFRVWKNHDVIALFPYEREYGGRVMSYEHVGQHGGADYSHVIECTRPAKPEEFADLARELRGIGYTLRILKHKGNPR